ncbi:MAG: hypothetical protein ACXVH1_26290 [Solirubrobacteraceae bacterium]
MPAPTAARVPDLAPSHRAGLRCRIRLADGRRFAGELAPERHRSLQLGMLHSQTSGLVELAAGCRRDGRLHITTRRRTDHFLPGGGAGERAWLEALLELAGRHAERGEEVFVAPATRSAPRGEKQAVSETRCLWVDVDRPGQLHALWAFLAERPCHVLIESGGSGGCHAYFKLAQPLPAARVVEATGELVEPIERTSTASTRRDQARQPRPGRDRARHRGGASPAASSPCPAARSPRLPRRLPLARRGVGVATPLSVADSVPPSGSRSSSTTHCSP